jgi:hypothetical protein
MALCCYRLEIEARFHARLLSGRVQKKQGDELLESTYAATAVEFVIDEHFHVCFDHWIWRYLARPDQ